MVPASAGLAAVFASSWPQLLAVGDVWLAPAWGKQTVIRHSQYYCTHQYCCDATMKNITLLQFKPKEDVRA